MNNNSLNKEARSAHEGIASSSVRLKQNALEREMMIDENGERE